MKITIVGGGNIGTQFAVHCAEAGHEVTIYTSTPELYHDYLNIVNEEDITIHEGKIKLATSNPAVAFKLAELILVTVPATMMRKVAELIYSHSNSDTIIGVAPGNGGSECAFKDCIERGNIFFSIERVPAIARLIKKGRTVRSVGYRSELHVASIPEKEASKCAEIINSIFHIPCKVIPCMLNLTMTPSNPILHTARLYSLFHDWHEGEKYKSIPLFYRDWNSKASEILLLMDDEEQKICRALREFDLSFVRSLKEHYESSSVEAMTKKISSIRAFKDLSTPAIQIDGGFVPDLHSRYFTADFSYGLNIIQQIGRMSNTKTPVIDEVMDWYRKIAVEQGEFRFEDYGIYSTNELKAFYLR